jgi:hypothetical protein
VSLLLSEGHPSARHYTLAHLWSEVRLVKRRINGKTKLDAVILQSVATSILDSKAGGRMLRKLLKRLDYDD